MLKIRTHMKLLAVPKPEWPGTFQLTSKRKRATYQFLAPTLDSKQRLTFTLCKADDAARPYHVTIRPDSSGWCDCAAARFGHHCCHVAAMQTIVASRLPDLLNQEVQI